MTKRLVFKNQLTGPRGESSIRQPYRPTHAGIPERFPFRAMWTRHGGGAMACEVVDHKWPDGTFRRWEYGRFLTQADLDAHPGLLEALAWTFGFRPLELMP